MYYIGMVQKQEGRIDLTSPVESSDLDEKVLATTSVRDTSSVGIWVKSSHCIHHILPPYGERGQ
jgi:hypothetical protein